MQPSLNSTICPKNVQATSQYSWLLAEHINLVSGYSYLSKQGQVTRGHYENDVCEVDGVQEKEVGLVCNDCAY